MRSNLLQGSHQLISKRCTSYYRLNNYRPKTENYLHGNIVRIHSDISQERNFKYRALASKCIYSPEEQIGSHFVSAWTCLSLPRLIGFESPDEHENCFTF